MLRHHNCRRGQLCVHGPGSRSGVGDPTWTVDLSHLHPRCLTRHACMSTLGCCTGRFLPCRCRLLLNMQCACTLRSKKLQHFGMSSVVKCSETSGLLPDVLPASLQPWQGRVLTEDDFFPTDLVLDVGACRHQVGG